MVNNHIIIRKCFREPIYTFSLFSVMCLLFITVFLSQSYQETQHYQRAETYGFHNGCAYNVSNASIDNLIHHKSVTKYGTMSIVGQIVFDGFPVGHIGYVDNDFCDLEDVNFLEGNYPVSPDEIVLETFLLDRLNLPYELGTPVSVTIQLLDNNTLRKTYTLCGIIQTYTTNWLSEDNPLCNAIIHSDTNWISQNHLFFLGDYENSEQMQEISCLVYGSENSQLVYNSYSYPEGNITIFEWFVNEFLTLVVAFVGGIFLACIQINGTRKLFYNSRILFTLGADKDNIFRLLLREAASKWLITYISSCSICTLLAFLLQFYFADSYHFCVTLKPYYLAGILSLAIVILGRTIQLILLSRIGNIPKGYGLTRYNIQASIPQEHSLVDNSRRFVQYQISRNFKLFFFEILMITSSCIVVFACSFGICNSYKTFRTTNEILGFDYSWTSNSPTMGLSKIDISTIKNTANVERILYTAKCNSLNDVPVRITYSDFRADDYLHAHNSSYPGIDGSDGLIIEVVAIPENSLLSEYYLDNSNSLESFFAGDNVVLFLPHLKTTIDGNYAPANTFDFVANEDQSNLISCNLNVADTINIVTNNGIYQKNCQEIMYSFPSYQQTTMDFLVPGTMLVSEKLYCELFDLDSIYYNYVCVFGNSKLSYDVADKQMSNISKTPGILFTNNRIAQETSRKLFISETIAMSSIMLMISSITIIILFQNRIYFLEIEKDRIALLKRLCCDKNTLFKIYMSGLGYISIPICMLCGSISIFIYAREYYRFIVPSTLISELNQTFTLAFHNFPILLLSILLIFHSTLIIHLYQLTTKRYINTI